MKYNISFELDTYMLDEQIELTLFKAFAEDIIENLIVEEVSES